ncbi:MAG: DUF1385 domain-containing protein [Chloroflexota bacterium]|nr:DUF1385 domain-containing protein [Chloroflexota bacterium]
MSDSNKKDSQISYGGQALIEGVMIRGKKAAVLAVRNPDGEIVKEQIKFSRFYNRSLLKIPILRGILNLADSLVVGTRALNFSANVAEGETDSKKNSEGVNLAIVISISLIIAIGIFFVTPALVSRVFHYLGFNNLLVSFLEGLIRLIFVIGYIYIIGLSKDIRRVFQYHGAEHMAVWAHEDGMDLSKSNLRNFTKEHPRCGTSFILLVVMVSIIVFMLFPRDNLVIFILLRIILVPVIAGISYELLKIGSKSRFKLVKNLLNGPGILIQKLTTKEPDESQLEVAIESMEYAIKLNED